MTPLNTIIEEEKKLVREKFIEHYRTPTIPKHAVREWTDAIITTAMQRAYEAGKEGCDTYWKERVEELELSCIDDRLLGKTDEYLDGYNTSTQRWREQRDNLLQELDNLK